MTEFKNDNDFSVTFFLMDERTISYKFIHSLHAITRYIEQNFGYWHHVNIYARRSGRFLIQVRRGQKMYNKYNWLLKR